MLDSLAELTKTLLIPGTLTFLLFGMTVGVLLACGPKRLRSIGLAWLIVLAAGYWFASVPAFAHLLATRFHAKDSKQVALEDVSDARAIVVLGAGIRNSYTAAGRVVTEPDRQTIFNAVEAARIYHLFPDGRPVLASGGRQGDAAEQASESAILRDWLVQAGVPAERIILESGSRTTREQAVLVAPMLKERHWERFVLVVPAVQLPRAKPSFGGKEWNRLAPPRRLCSRRSGNALQDGFRTAAGSGRANAPRTITWRGVTTGSEAGFARASSRSV